MTTRDKSFVLAPNEQKLVDKNEPVRFSLLDTLARAIAIISFISLKILSTRYGTW